MLVKEAPVVSVIAFAVPPYVAKGAPNAPLLICPAAVFICVAKVATAAKKVEPSSGNVAGDPTFGAAGSSVIGDTKLM